VFTSKGITPETRIRTRQTKDQKMKTTFSIEITPALKAFEPIEGTWTADFDRNTESCWDAVPALEEQIGKLAGFAVEVEIFRANGYAITDDPQRVKFGSMLVIRR